jgi:DNA-binding beta-propeller fold protein YncE
MKTNSCDALMVNLLQQPLNLLLQDKFDPFGPQISSINNPLLPVDGRIKFLCIQTTIAGGSPPGYTAASCPLIYNAAQLCTPSTYGGTRGSIVMPAGSDGIVDLAGQVGGVGTARTNFSNGFLSDVAHADFAALNFLPFGVPAGQSQTTYSPLAQFVVQFLAGSANSFGSFYLPLMGSDELRGLIDANAPQLTSADMIAILSSLPYQASPLSSQTVFPLGGVKGPQPTGPMPMDLTNSCFIFGIQPAPGQPVGGSVNWFAQVYGTNGVSMYGVTVQESGTNDTQATVCVQNGVVGTVVIQASYLSANGTLVVANPVIVLSNPPGELTNIFLNPNGLNINVGEQVPIQIWGQYDSGMSAQLFIPSGTNVAWSSSNPGVFQVDTNFNGQAFSNGTAVVSAVYLSQTGLASVVVNPSGYLVVVDQPQRQVWSQGQSATFNVRASGAGPMSYQWYCSGALVAGATNSALVITNLQPTDSGTYVAVVTNAVSSATSAEATLTVLLPGQLFILGQPQSQTLSEGRSLQFTVSASGSGPVFYWWYFNGTPIAGATNSVLVITNVSTTNLGNYFVVLTNSVGSLTSAVASLTVAFSPQIVIQPGNQAAVLGSNATLVVVAVGKSPLSYQWQFDGTNLAGATGASLTIANAQLANAGNYQVIVSNIYGSTTSAMAALTVTPPPPFFVFSFGTPGSGQGQFSSPLAVAPDSSANIYVADLGNNRIEKFDSKGAYLLQWGSSGTNFGQFNGPSGLALDSAGNVYVADVNNNRIQKFNSTGAFITQWGGLGSNPGQFSLPTGLAIDASDSVFVADFGNSRIQKFSSNGAFITQWGSGGTNAGQFRFAQAAKVAVDGSGNVYVTDAGNTRVQKFGGGGTFLAQWSVQPTNGALTPYSIAVDLVGNVYVGDYAHRIQRFATDGTYLTQWGSYGTSTGQFAFPDGLAVDATGNFIYVADTGNQRIQVFAYIFPPFITSQPTNQIALVGSNVTLTIQASSPGPLSYQWQLNGTNIQGAMASSLIVSNAQIASSGNYQVVITNLYGTTTSAVATLAVGFPPQIVGSPISQSVPVGVSAAFTVAATGTAPLTYQWQFKGTNLTDNTRITGSQSSALTISNLLFAHAGNYAVAVANAFGSTNSQPAILNVLGPTNTGLYAFTNFAGLPGLSGTNDGAGSTARFYGPRGVAVDSAGNVFVADTFNHTIRKITAAGVVTTLAGLAGSSGTNDGTGSAARFFYPTGVAVDSAGNVFVADSNNHAIRKVTATGVVTTLAGLSGAQGTNDGIGSAARFRFPAGVAVDSEGNVFVGDGGNETIRNVTPAGVVTTLAGLAGSYGSADGTGSAARFFEPDYVAVDSTGNIFVADLKNQTIRKVTSAGMVTTLAGRAGSSGSADGTNSTARFNAPNGVAVDSVGNLFVADSSNDTIRKVSPVGTNWVVTTLAGLGGSYGTNDGMGSAARFNAPHSVALDSAGNLYVTDANNHRITKGTPVIQRLVPVLVWTNPTAISYGTALSASQLNATASVPGTFTYSPPAGTAPNAGTKTLSVVFAPTDTTNYGSTIATLNLVVLPAPLAITASNATRTYGMTNPVFTGTITGLQNGDTVTATYACSATPPSPPGAYPITVTLVDPASRLGNYTVTTNNGTLTVLGLPPQVQAVAQAGSTLMFTWSAMTGKTYQVQYSAGLAPANWTNLGNPITATSATTTALDSMTNSQRFYRVVLLP